MQTLRGIHVIPRRDPGQSRDPTRERSGTARLPMRTVV